MIEPLFKHVKSSLEYFKNINISEYEKVLSMFK